MLVSILLLALAQPDQVTVRTLPEIVAGMESGETFVLPDGVVTIREPLRISGIRNAKLLGGKNTYLSYEGSPTQGVVQVIGCANVTVEGFEIGNNSNGVDSSILLANLPQMTPISTDCTVRRIFSTWGGSRKPTKYGISINSYAVGGRDGNNEQHRIEACSMYHYSKAAFHIKGSQCHQIVFDRCKCSPRIDAGQSPYGYGLWCEEGVFFKWTSGSTANHEADFLLEKYWQSAFIENNSEWSKQFIKTGTTGSRLRLTVTNSRVDCRPVAGVPAIDISPCQGPITIDGVQLFSINGVMPQIRFDTYRNSPADAEVKNTIFTIGRNSLPSDQPIVVGAGVRYRETANSVSDRAGTVQRPARP